MTENNREELVQSADTTSDDVEGHYLPLDVEGNVDLTPHRVETFDDVEGHAEFDLDLDIERRR